MSLGNGGAGEGGGSHDVQTGRGGEGLVQAEAIVKGGAVGARGQGMGVDTPAVEGRGRGRMGESGRVCGLTEGGRGEGKGRQVVFKDAVCNSQGWMLEVRG